MGKIINIDTGKTCKNVERMLKELGAYVREVKYPRENVLQALLFESLMKPINYILQVQVTIEGKRQAVEVLVIDSDSNPVIEEDIYIPMSNGDYEEDKKHLMATLEDILAPVLPKIR